MKKNNWLFLILICSISLFALSFFQIESDYLWHIKAGEAMIQKGIFRHDIFSWSLSSSYWYSHEWLFEVVIYYLKSIFGKYHIFIYCFSCIFFINFFIYLMQKDYIEKNKLFYIIWVALSLIICVQVQARPFLISFLFFSIMMYLLSDSIKNQDSKKIYLLPFIGVLWANFHGGSSNLIYIIPIIFLAGNIFTFQFKKIESKKISNILIKRYLIVIVLCMVSVCINIHGIKMFIYPYINMANTMMISNISEWRSTSLNEVYHYLYFGLLFIIIIILLFSKKKIQFIDFLLLGFCSFLGLKSIRFWFYTYIVASTFIYSYISNRKEDKGTSLGIIIISIMMCSLFLLKNNIFTENYSFLLKEEDIKVIKNENPKRLFNMYNYGGDLIYNDILVFIDGRADLYSPEVYGDYLSISKLDSNSISNIEKYDFDYYLVDSKYPIASYLKDNSKYELIYSRNRLFFYKKRDL